MTLFRKKHSRKHNKSVSKKRKTTKKKHIRNNKKVKKSKRKHVNVNKKRKTKKNKFRNKKGGAITDKELELIRYCMFGKLDDAKLLYQNNPTINISVRNEEAFRYSCKNGHLDTAKWLLEIKPTIDISAKNDEAFIDSCKNGRLDVAKWLYEIKPSIDIKNLKKAYMYSREKGQLNVADWLLEIKPEIKPNKQTGKKTKMTLEEFNKCEKDEEGNVNDPITFDNLTIDNAVMPPSASGNKSCFDRESIERWLNNNNTHPITREAIPEEWKNKYL